MRRALLLSAAAALDPQRVHLQQRPLQPIAAGARLVDGEVQHGVDDADPGRHAHAALLDGGAEF